MPPGPIRRFVWRRGVRWIAALAVASAALWAVASPAPAETDESLGTSFVVAPWGSDANDGSEQAPWRTIDHALRSLVPGDTLYVRGGTYRERVKLYGSAVSQGTAAAPVHVQAYPGERPVIEGLLWLDRPDFWIIQGLGVTWGPDNTANEHMVKFIGGRGWQLRDTELWGAQSFAALLIEQEASDFVVADNYIHDTAHSNDANQDHLIYANNGPNGSGVIERNLLVRSPNGRGVKLGPASLSKPGTSNIVIRYNTFVDNRGPSNVQLSGSSSDNEIYRNIMVSPKNGSESVTGWRLSGTDNSVHDNLGWDAVAVLEADEAGIVDHGGNKSFDPVFADLAAGDFTPTHQEAIGYGHTARAGVETPSSTPTSTTTTTTTPATSTTTTAAPATTTAAAETDSLEIVRVNVAMQRNSSEVTVQWTGSNGRKVDIERTWPDGTIVDRVSNKGELVDRFRRISATTLTYRVCEVAEAVTCSDPVTVSF